MSSQEKVRRHFERRQRAAVDGVHLPSNEELLRGMSFLRERLDADAREYAERTARRIRRKEHTGFAGLLDALDELASGVTSDSVAAVVSELARAPEDRAVQARELRVRCGLYLAWQGDPDAMAATAGEMAALAYDDGKAGRDPGGQQVEALSWGTVSTVMRRRRPGDGPLGLASHIVGSEVSHCRYIFRRIGEEQVAARVKADQTEIGVSHDAPLEQDDGHEEAEDAEATSSGVTVLSTVGNANTPAGKLVKREFEEMTGVRLPLPPLPDLAPARQSLAYEFPYAVAVIDAVLAPLAGRAHVHLPPTVFVGSPGSGKTRFARRLAEVLALPYEIVPCGGIADSSPGGTPRQWSSGQPSLAVMAVRQSGSAGPLIILDEIDKTGDGRHNGRFHDVLLGLLEQESARRWMDPYLMASCDLSHVSWLMTANTPDPIPKPLRDRLRFIRFPDPRPEDLGVLAQSMLEARCRDLGLDMRWAEPLDGTELDALSGAWGGGSLRVLRRLVEGVWHAREAAREHQ